VALEIAQLDAPAKDVREDQDEDAGEDVADRDRERRLDERREGVALGRSINEMLSSPGGRILRAAI